MKSFLLWAATIIVAVTPVAGTLSFAEVPSQSMPPERLQDDIAGFSARMYTSGGEMMRYRLFVPDGLDPRSSTRSWSGCTGREAWASTTSGSLADDQVPGTQTWTEPANQAKHPAFVLAPQSSVGWLAQPQSRRPNALSPPLKSVIAILDSLSRQYPIDQKRIYVAGQSDGGYAVWNLIANRPDRFAAAIILCGGGDPAQARRLVNLPLWVFHGTADPMVPVSASAEHDQGDSEGVEGSRATPNTRGPATRFGRGCLRSRGWWSGSSRSASTHSSDGGKQMKSDGSLSRRRLLKTGAAAVGGSAATLLGASPLAAAEAAGRPGACEAREARPARSIRLLSEPRPPPLRSKN